MLEMIRNIVSAAREFEKESHQILSIHEASTSRVVVLEDTYRDLRNLSLQQDELFRQALRCVEHGLYRAAHVMAWAAFMDFFENKLGEDGFHKLRGARRNWQLNSIEELRENQSEYQIIEAARAVNLCNRNQQRALLGLLNKRNECAHPSDYFPDLNETLGFVSELLQRIKILANKSI